MKNKVCLAVIVLAGALSLPAGPAAAGTLTVDDDGAQCPNAEHSSIQAAVNDARATPGTTITVCPGLYPEAVDVAKPSLKLEARGRNQGGKGECFDSDPEAPDPRHEVIVEGAEYSFNLAANDVELSRFVVQGANYGIVTDPSFSGYEIRDNLVQHNSRAGINFRSSGAEESVVRHNCFRGNERGTESENPGTLVNARIDHNSTFRNGRIGIGATGVPGERSDVRIEDNSSREDGLEFLLFSGAIMLSNSKSSRIARNDSLASSRGVWVAGGNVGLQVVRNRVRESVANGILMNVRTSEPMVANVALDVSHNDVRDSGSSGIVVSFASTTNSFFYRNRVRDNAIHGFFFAGTASRVERNRADGNGADGIRSLRGASGNVFVSNRMKNNVEHDAHDDNRAGNVWVNNRCDTDFPSETICERSPSRP